MVDVTATPVGLQKTTVNLVDGVYVINRNASGYKVQLNADPSPFAPVAPTLVIISVDPAATDTNYTGAFLVNGQGFTSAGPLAQLWVTGDFVSFQVSWLETVPDIQLGTQSGIVQQILALSPPTLDFRFMLIPEVGDPVFSPWVSVALVPGIPEITSVTPPATDDPAQLFTLGGTSFSEATQLTVHDDALDPLYFPVVFTIDNDNQISVTQQAVQLLIDNGSVVPFQFRFRIWDYAAARGFSDYIPVNSPAADPMADAFITAYDGGPDQINVSVGVGPTYNLAALDPPTGYVQSVGQPGHVPSLGSYSAGIWFRRREATGFSLGTFLQWQIQTLPVLKYVRLEDAAGHALAATAGTDSAVSLPGTLDDTDMGWHFACIVRDQGAGSISLYLDGTLLIQNLIGLGNNMVTNDPLVIGRDGLIPDPSVQATGAVWHRALDGAEVSAINAATIYPL
jgi:hypothetical protein